MCMTAETIKTINEKMEEIQTLKRLKEETESAISALEREVINFLIENEEDCKTTNKSGKEILQFIGSVHKANYSEQSRETVNKEEVKKILSDEQYQKVSKVSTYKVLRIS